MQRGTASPALTPAAIYARYSTDLQDARSIADQLALCQSYAARENFSVVATYSDAARSGASIIGRDGLIALMAAAQERRFAVLIVEHTDRLARSMRDLADIHDRLTFLGIEIRAIHSGGAMSTAMIGLFGLVGQMQREDGAKKVHRGMAGRVRDGKSAGGRAYGYRPLPGSPGELQIVEAEAKIVRRIFAEYVAGATPRLIAAGLNRDAIAAPRGTMWNASTINGSKARGIGILHCALYVGKIVWNKVRMLKDPATGKRVSRPNPRSEWQVTPAPHLAILDAELLAAAARRNAAQSHAGAAQARRPKHLLSGLIRCSRCGGGMAVMGRWRGRRRVGCSRRRESGTCDNARTFDLATIETRIVDGLRQNLDDPRLIAEYVAAYNEERRRLAKADSGARHKRARRLQEVERIIARAVDSICDGTADKPTLGPKLKALTAEKAALIAAIAAAGKSAEIVTLHPTAIARYRQQLEHLHTALTDGGGAASVARGAALPAFRALVDSVIIDADAPGTEIILRGRLAALTGAKTFPDGIGVGGIGGSGGALPAIPPTLGSPIFALRIA